MSDRSDRRARAYVRDYLANVCRVELNELPSRGDQTTPDFEMVEDGRRILVAELKTLEERRPTEEAGWTIEVDQNGIQEAHRPHNGPARIARKIIDAHQQLSACPHPWAVILLNTDHFMLVGDFFEAFTGKHILGTMNGHRVVNIASRPIALGPKFAVRYEVDLYLWLDQLRKPALGVWWSTPVGEEIARRYFSAAERGTS
jgi:hypothetical protein